MKIKVYAIYDSKTTTYSPPWFARNNAAAIRNFQDLVNDRQSTVSKHPEDYSLHYIGTFDDDTAQIEPDKHLNLGLAAEYANEKDT